jgi:hypothetical protein
VHPHGAGHGPRIDPHPGCRHRHGHELGSSLSPSSVNREAEVSQLMLAGRESPLRMRRSPTTSEFLHPTGRQGRSRSKALRRGPAVRRVPTQVVGDGRIGRRALRALTEDLPRAIDLRLDQRLQPTKHAAIAIQQALQKYGRDNADRGIVALCWPQGMLMRRTRSWIRSPRRVRRTPFPPAGSPAARPPARSVRVEDSGRRRAPR